MIINPKYNQEMKNIYKIIYNKKFKIYKNL